MYYPPLEIPGKGDPSHSINPPRVSMKYQYEPLEAGHIRLLRFNEDERKGLTIDSFHVSNLPPYTALSYHWGAESPTKYVLLNGQDYGVTPHLSVCLHQLRHYMIKFWTWSSSLHASFLWIDAICIDQSNAPEKNQQVRMMDAIYSGAAEVTIWLGPWYFSCDTLQGSIPQLVYNPYWTRMWIVQELLLAQRARIIAGWHSLTFTEFCAMVNSHVNDASYKSNSDLDTELPCIRVQSPGKRPLRVLMFDFGNWKCRDEKDRVFALLSLVPDHERSCLDKFFPDYALARESIITITLSFLCGIGGMEIEEAAQILFQKGLGRGLYHTREIDLMRRKALEFNLEMTRAEWNAVRSDWQTSLLSDLADLIIELRQLEASILSPENRLEETDLEARKAEVQRWRTILHARRIDKNIAERGFDPEAPYRERLKQHDQLQSDLQHAEYYVRTLQVEPSRSRDTCKIHTHLECAEAQVFSAKYLRATFTIMDPLAAIGHEFEVKGSTDLAFDTDARASHAFQEAAFA